MKSTMGCALITGGSQGLGRALAEECAGRGMDLVLVALPDTGLRPLAEILRRAYEVRIETVELVLQRFFARPTRGEAASASRQEGR